MPRFPDYRAEIGLNPGSTPQVRTGAEAIGQGLQALGSGLTAAGEGLAAYQAKAARENAFDDEARFNQRNRERQAEFEAATRNMPPGGGGFAARYLQATQKGDSALIAKISPGNRPAFAARLSAQRDLEAEKAAIYEQQYRAGYETQEIEGSRAEAEQAISRNPAAHADEQRRYFEQIDRSGLPLAQKSALKQTGRQGFAATAWNARYGEDPEAGAAAFGRGPVPTGRFQTRLVSGAGTDIDGLSPATKALLDGMVAAGVVPELKVKSGRRDQAVNAAAGGARGSQHLAGNALDIDIAGKSDAEKAAILAAAVASGARGIGLYAGGRSLHVDTRQAPTVWGLDAADAYRGLKKPDGTPDIEATLAKAPAWARPTLQRLYGEPAGTLPLPAFGETPVAASPGALDYFGLVRQHESGGNDQAASRGPDGQTIAVGRYQFTAGTWAALAQKHPGLELSADGRSDPRQQERAMRALTADNQAALAKAGLPITGANTYMAHFLGAAGAVKFLQALREDPEQSAAELFPAAAASNKGVFYDHNSGGARSLAEVYRRQTAMFGADAGQSIYSAGPGYADAPADPAFADIPPWEQDRLLNQAAARGREGESLSRGALESGVRDATRDLTTIGRHDGPLPGIADFTKAYGPQAGARHYADFQRVVSLGADIDAIKAMTPAEQSAWLARFTPQGDGPDPDGTRDRYARARQAIAFNLAFRSKDPNAYVRALNPRIDRLWTEAGNSPDRLKAALSATNAAMDRLGMPLQERRLIPKAMVDQALAAFGDRSKPMAQRLAPLRAAIVAGADPGAQQAIFGQMVSAGLPPTLEYAAIAYAKGDAPLAERFATAALRNLDAGGKTTGDPTDASFASPAAAANAPAGPAPMRSLSGPAIDLGPAADQALGSSLTGDERSNRAETVRTRMIEDAMRSNGGDRPAAIAQTDRDLASLQGDGWVPGMFMREPEALVPVQVAQSPHAAAASKFVGSTLFSTGQQTSRNIQGTETLPSIAESPTEASTGNIENTPPAKARTSSLDPALRAQDEADDEVIDKVIRQNESQNYPEDINRKSAAIAMTKKFKLYRSNLPSIAAARDINALGDSDDAPQPGDGITRLPLSAQALSEELNLPPGILTDRMLRDDQTGFRAVLYRDDRTGRLILGARDTQQHSYIDWWTNIMNGMGILTPQYRSMIELARTLNKNNVQFDIVGYSKGGGLAQAAGLVSPNSKVTVFNSAGIPDAALAWTGAANFDSLTRRTTSFSSENEFLTNANRLSEASNKANAAYTPVSEQFQRLMQGLPLGPGMAEGLADQFDKQTNLGKLQTDAQAAADREIVMVKWLRNELAKNSSLVISLDYLSPANKDPNNPEFIKMKNDFIAQLDRIIAERENNKFGPAFFPPVRAGTHTDLQHSEGWMGLGLSMSPDRDLPGGINLDKMGQMAQHQVGNVYDGFKINIDGYRRMLNIENDLNKRINANK